MNLSKNKTRLLIGITIVAQLLVASFVLADAWRTRTTGEEITLRATPVDPRSMFRGNYARIRYDISSVSSEGLATAYDMRRNQKVFVVLRKAADDIYDFESIHHQKPQRTSNTVVLQARASYCNNNTCELRYGLEAFFAPKAKALDLERRLRQPGALAKVMVRANGKSALMDIVSAKALEES